MKKSRLDDLFEVTYGNKFDLNKMAQLPTSLGGVNFVGRSSRNHGVSGTVAQVEGVSPYEAGLITVALGGSKLLSSFVQLAPFYTAQNVAVLRPLKKMTINELVFVCVCIRHNRFRYSAFGREANRTIREIEIPSPTQFPGWVSSSRWVDDSQLELPQVGGGPLKLDVGNWEWCRLGTLFDIRKGKRLTKRSMTKGTTPFIAAIAKDNGVRNHIGHDPIHEGNTITVNYNGSVAEAFYQPVPYWCSDDVNVLYPKFELTPLRALFIVTIIRQERFRYNYGRKWHLERMRETMVRLPCGKAESPDWDWVDQYMSRLPYSSLLPPSAVPTAG